MQCSLLRAVTRTAWQMCLTAAFAATSCSGASIARFSFWATAKRFYDAASLPKCHHAASRVVRRLKPALYAMVQADATRSGFDLYRRRSLGKDG